jgi:glycosyltransferase involved in cell wall biosynthesis
MTMHLKEADVQAGPTTRARETERPAPPRVSIGMPVFNGMRYIERAVNSLLAQSFGDFELIILDNASTDGTHEFARALTKDPRVQMQHNNRNIGAIGNFIKVLGLARGEYFMWAPVDDVWEPEFVARLVAELDRHPAVGVAMSATRRVRGSGDTKDIVRFLKSQDPGRMGPLRLALELGSSRKCNFFINGLFRRRLLQRAAKHFPEGGAPERILLAQLALHSRFQYVDEVLYQRQLHETLHEHRYPDEAYSRVVAMGFRGDLHFLRSLTVSLCSSRVVPLRRKLYIPLVVARFAATRLSGRLFHRASARAVLNNLKATQKRLADTTRQLEKQRRTIKSLEERGRRLTERLDKQSRRIEGLEAERRNPPTNGTAAAPEGSEYPTFKPFEVNGRKLKLICRSVKEVRRIKRLFREEADTLEWLSRTLLPADIFFDVGANAGVFAVFAGSLVGPSGRVYAFEPHLPNATALIMSSLMG